MEEINNLREALQVSPDNVPLRKYLADLLMKQGQFADAEQEYKKALKLAHNDNQLKVGLANAFLEQGKISVGLVLTEEILSQDRPPARAWLTYAKLQYAQAQYLDAKDAYEKALLVDPNLADAYWESQLNVKLSESGQGNGPEKIKLSHYGEEEDEQDGYAGIDVERPKETFEQVGGMEKIKEEIRLKIIHPLAHPEIYKAYGKKIGGGILLYGPPGCGKTHLARATAGEIKTNFISVGISEVLDMYIGQSEQNLHALFEQARDYKPCVLFFDEVDALGASRTDMRHSAGRQLINQFLAEMDGIDATNEGVLILAATNAPWHLDPAFRRPGRFDRIIFVPPPDEPARESILQIMLKDKPTEPIDYKQLAKQTPDFSGADLKALVDIAVEEKLTEAMKRGTAVPLTTKDLLAAAKKHKPTTKEWFTTAKNYAIFSNESGQYDDILKYMNLKK